MLTALTNFFAPKVTEQIRFRDEEFEALGLQLKMKIDAIFGRSFALREVDAGSDNAPEIELNNLSTPYYDIERFGVSFVASPRHADALAVTGPVTQSLAVALKKTYDATPAPKLVIAIGDDACDGGLFKGSYAVLGGAEKVVPVDVKIPGNPPTPLDIMKGLLALMNLLQRGA
ncbi:formate hydrogenlyase subunit 7 [Candidatus Moduliflexus flocculans]|uniref:Formate hydrogenlyase subunit 7 n=1 Tax=Candidatus Moduliflexus flocculans TaxID=1499966 RepID=A0A0S6W4A8_9BACT|nr:formate hydrogenlyase subunit 7 [Candidatus Moduliflexus flocculans]